MMKFSVRNREVIKVFACVLFMFVILWCSINMRIIFGSVKVSPDNITSIMRDKYQNCIQILGIIVPIVYSLAFYKIFALGEKHIIIRYGKRRYEKIESKNIFIFSFIFAVEYILTDFIFMNLFSDISVLLKSAYYLFVLLKFIMLILYLNLIGATLYILRNILGFSNLYIMVGSLIYVLWTSLYYILLSDTCPSFYMNFATEWFDYHTFDSFSYIINLAKLFFASLILKYLGEIVFLRRDILENEEN